VFASIPVLSAPECALVRETVLALRPHWTLRGSSGHPFYTVGAASYIDANSPTPRYTELLAQTNPLLREHFGWLHSRVMYALSLYLQAVVRTADELALPGFHIWEGLAVPTWPVSIHFDLQYQSIPWADAARADRTQPLSFTLPIALPLEGGGLNSWDLSYEGHLAQIAKQNRAHQYSPLEELMRTHTRTYHAYECGTLTLHSGHTVHQIAPVEQAFPDDERITLQGHGLYCDGAWTLYW